MTERTEPTLVESEPTPTSTNNIRAMLNEVVMDHAGTRDLVYRARNKRDQALRALAALLDADDPQFCQGDVYNEGGDEQLDCTYCAWCVARRVLERPEVNV